MGKVKALRSAGLFFLCVSGVASAQIMETKYNLFNGEVGARAICGSKICAPGDRKGTLLTLNRAPYRPEVTDSSSARSIASDLLGRVTFDRSGGTPSKCGTSGQNLFLDSDTASLGSSGRLVATTLKRTVKAEIDVSAAVTADLEALRRLALPSSIQLADLEAELTAAYKDVNAKELSLDTSYYEYGLKSDTLHSIRTGQRFLDCYAFLQRDPTAKLITAVGVIWYSANYQSATLNDAFAKVKTALEANKIKYNLEASVKRQVEESIKSKAEFYEIIAWRLHDSKAFDKL